MLGTVDLEDMDKETWPTGESGTNLPTLPSIVFLIWAKKGVAAMGWHLAGCLMREASSPTSLVVAA